jgi:hypothetical protein
LIVFLELHARVTAVGADDALDAGTAADLVAAAHERARRERERAEAAARQAAAPPPMMEMPAVPPPPPAPPAALIWPPPRRAYIRWTPYGPPVISGVVIDFPISAVCRSDAACGPTQRCADRGDGVPLCVGAGARHPFCAAPSDCRAGVCLRRPDGVGVCPP